MAKFTYNDQEKKTLHKMFLNSGLVFCGFNQVKMEANAFTCTMAPAIDELYKDPEERGKALKRANGFFNTHAVMFSFIAGLTYALEKEKMTKGSVDDDVIENIKVALMGPTAGIGDAFFFNCLRVIAAGIGIGLCSQGNILGVLLFILIYGGSQIACRYYLLRVGYSLGTSFIDSVFSSGLMDSLTKAASIVGLSMVGAMTATTVNVPFNWTINVGKTSVVVLDLFEAIYPGILSVGIVLLMMALIKKGKKPITLIVGLIVAGLLGAFLHIF